MLHRDSMGHNVLEKFYVKVQSVVDMSWVSAVVFCLMRSAAEPAVSREV